MKIIQVVSAATGERFAPVAFSGGLREFYEEIVSFLQIPDEDDAGRDKWETMKKDYVLVLSEVSDSGETQFSLLPMMTVERVFDLFKAGTDEPSRPYISTPVTEV